GDGVQEALALRVEFAAGRVRGLFQLHENIPLDLVRLEPPLIGGIYPGKNEDRVLVELSQVPSQVVEALIAVEDRRFFSHHGIDPRGILRALFATLRGEGIQGGSTLTQQLVKNFYLTSERTLRRKFTEMIMALLLEWHYSKEEILETYLNEVYLGQDGNRAIHGFGLASYYYFDKPLEQLSLSEASLLVGMLKGPSQYSPRSHPQTALKRRNLVLAQMVETGVLSRVQVAAAQAAPLGIVSRPSRGTSPYPAFLQLVHRQLRRDYRDEDLRSEGLQIFTSLDPQVQGRAEATLKHRLDQLEQERRMPPGSLQGALLVTSTQNAEVQAVVGGRNPRFEGFNRALDAQRPIGSLIKPAIYLAALEQPQRYTLATPLDDSPLVVSQAGSKDWAPQNYDREFHDQVLLHRALANSYNVASVRLGLDLGIPRVLESLRRLGVGRELPGYAASMLGANALSPMEVTQVYQTIAGGGFRTPLNAIREVLSATGEPLQRYPLKVVQEFGPVPVYLLSFALQEVVREGTARTLVNYLPAKLAIAAKTGTTDDYRDSWFAGFSGDRLAVVWIGRDDNEPTGLSGAGGALTVWGEMMAGLAPQPLVLPEPEQIEWLRIDGTSGLRTEAGCPGADKLPFSAGSAPTESVPCADASPGTALKNFFQRIFQ
ncbi:MAG: penicillin-binding protein 1B, partial [Desulfuromonadaceae bacterium]